jgi:hypothetical protein
MQLEDRRRAKINRRDRLRHGGAHVRDLHNLSIKAHEPVSRGKRALVKGKDVREAIAGLHCPLDCSLCGLRPSGDGRPDLTEPSIPRH